MNMTASENERFNYACGDLVNSDCYLAQCELQDELDILCIQSESEANSAFMRGYDEGFGTDHVATIKNIEHDLDKARDTTEKSKVLVRTLLEMFSNDMMKSVAGRKILHNQLQAKLILLNY